MRGIFALFMLGLAVALPSKDGWTVPLPQGLNSLEVVAPEGILINYESGGADSEIKVKMELDESAGDFNMEYTGDTDLKLTINGTLPLACGSPSTGPCWAVLVLALMTGLGYQGGNFQSQGRPSLVLFTLLMLGSLAIAECPATSITVVLPSKLCWVRSSATSIKFGGACSPGNVWSSNETEPVTEAACSTGQSNVVVTLMTDNYGMETDWTLKRNGQMVLSGGNIAKNTRQVKQGCLAAGDYTFTINDAVGGLCCFYGKGYFNVKVGGKQVYAGARMKLKTMSQTIKIGHTPSMTTREQQFLTAHNTRRRTWHVKFGKTYVPLKWSAGLEADALGWANKLKQDVCIAQTKNIYHASGITQSENINANKGTGSWGDLMTADKIVEKFIDRESTWNAPDNNHFTTALWRTSTYVGCAESEYSDGKGYVCRIQVCRYIKAGNCGLAASKDPQKLDVTMADDDHLDCGCGACCPPEGCYA